MLCELSMCLINNMWARSTYGSFCIRTTGCYWYTVHTFVYLWTLIERLKNLSATDTEFLDLYARLLKLFIVRHKTWSYYYIAHGSVVWKSACPIFVLDVNESPIEFVSWNSQRDDFKMSRKKIKYIALWQALKWFIVGRRSGSPPVYT